MNISPIILVLLAAIVAIPVAVLLIVYVLVPILKFVGRAIAHVFRFIGGEITDVLRFVGALVTSVVLVPLVVTNIVVGRWSASSHFGRAFQGELRNAGLAAYRVLIAHPARLFCLSALTEGLEKRLPEVVAAAPGRDTPSKRAGAFDGYTITGSLAGGGSGGKLYVASPEPSKAAAFQRAGLADVRDVVIKSFSLTDGSSLPQIVRESRALDAAKRLGLVLDHELTNERFYYVMRYVPGEPLGIVSQRLHAASGSEGLGSAQMSKALSFSADLLRTLRTYHQGGLWHKDVKPDNIIVDGVRAHLVDLGLITPLRSAMTLTTHGTEYFRDPEMVRLALRGVKVHQVDGAKFDIYAAGAVLYSMVEGSFPAHGGLSQIGKRCPESVRWIVRRAMTDYERRYSTADEMLADVEFVLASSDPFSIKPIGLPSMRGPGGAPEATVVRASHTPVPPPLPGQTRAAGGAGGPAAGIGAAGAAAMGGEAARAPRSRPVIRIADWWTGRYEVAADPSESSPPAAGSGAPKPESFRPIRGASPYTAAEQIRRAHERAEAVRARARERAGAMQSRRYYAKGGLALAGETSAAARARARASAAPAGLNFGVFMAVAVFLGLGVLGVSLWPSAKRGAHAPVEPHAPTLPEFVAGDLGDVESVDVPDFSVNGERIVVLRDPIAFAPEPRAIIDPALARLADRGFDLIGAFDSEDPEALASQTERIADLRKSIGLAPFMSDEARQKLAAWFESQADVAMLVWVGRDQDADEPVAWVVERPSGDAELSSMARKILDGSK